MYFEQHDEYISKQTDAYKVFVNKAMRYNYLEDYYNTLKNLMRYIRLKPDNEELPKYLLQTLSSSFRHTGYRQEAIKYAEKILYLDGDSLNYYINLFDIEQSNGDFLSAQKYVEIAHRFNEDYDWCLFLLLGNSIMLKNYKMAKKYVDEIENSYDVLPDHLYTELFLGFAYFKNGMYEEAEKNLQSLENRLIESIEYNLPEAQFYYAYFNLANVYSLRNEKEKALGYLKEVLKRESITQIAVMLLKESPFFENIRGEPEFQEILTRATEKYQRDHKRVGELLKDFGEIE